MPTLLSLTVLFLLFLALECSLLIVTAAVSYHSVQQDMNYNDRFTESRQEKKREKKKQFIQYRLEAENNVHTQRNGTLKKGHRFGDYYRLKRMMSLRLSNLISPQIQLFCERKHYTLY